jgi:hypothetical protein
MAEGPKFKPHPQSAPGDFYVENGQCLACGVPHVVAPDLVGWADEKLPHCIWRKQPQTRDEYERAVKVLEGQELDCHRYAGNDPAILRRLSRNCCDYPEVEESGTDIADLKTPMFALLDQPKRLGMAWRKLMKMARFLNRQ